MRGMLKSKSPGTQILLVISMALVGVFIIGMIGTLILAPITGMSLIQLSQPAKWNYNDPAVITAIRGMQLIQFISLFVFPVWICSRLFSTNGNEYLGLRKPPEFSFYLIAVLAMIVALPLVNWLGELNRSIRFPPDIEQWFKIKEENAAKMIQALLQRHTIKDLLLNIIFIAALAAIGEELLFRGLLQRLFIKFFKNHWIGIIVSAILFSALHMQFYGFFPRLALGILLGLIYWYSGSLWVAILAHFVYDAALIILAYNMPEMIKDESTVEMGNMYALGSLSLVLIVLAVVWMKKKSHVTYEQVYADDKVPVKDNPF